MPTPTTKRIDYTPRFDPADIGPLISEHSNEQNPTGSQMHSNSDPSEYYGRKKSFNRDTSSAPDSSLKEQMLMDKAVTNFFEATRILQIVVDENLAPDSKKAEQAQFKLNRAKEQFSEVIARLTAQQTQSM